MHTLAVTSTDKYHRHFQTACSTRMPLSMMLYVLFIKPLLELDSELCGISAEVGMRQPPTIA